MGWTGLHRAPGTSDRDFFEQEFPATLMRDGRILDCATVGNVFYAAVANNDTAPYKPGKTWALIVLMRRGRGEYNFHYKEMDEGMGPVECRCPERILDRLSMTEDEFALNWRSRCQDYHDARKAKGTIRKGETVVFTAPENIAALGPLTRTDGRKGIFHRVNTGGLIHIPWWRKATWEPAPTN
jgi:hypothetical protein